MQQHQLRPPKGAKKDRRRKGRGDGSGRGTYSGRGIKGQNSRSGGGVRPGFEGGQQRLIKGMPMLRGFTNIFRTEYTVVNVDTLAALAGGDEITPESLVEAGVIKNLKKPIKVLGDGEISVAVNVAAHRFSRSAREKIEAAGGSTREVA
ncbi:MAG: 50S ribosomal protein L15 [Dehalococcoidia bacterium]|nr:50S ribosomal protein L15 [Dehalococcoidia bacterium]